jgi:hypothetical protein
MSGPRIWRKYSKKLENKSLFFSHVLSAVAEMLEFNEKDKDSCGTAHIAGHSATLDNITAADGITLAHNNLTYVQQLFATNELTGNLDPNQDAAFPEQLQRDHPWLVEKCRNLRQKLKDKGWVGNRTIGNFCRTLEG